MLTNPIKLLEKISTLVKKKIRVKRKESKRRKRSNLTSKTTEFAPEFTLVMEIEFEKNELLSYFRNAGFTHSTLPLSTSAEVR